MPKFNVEDKETGKIVTVEAENIDDALTQATRDKSWLDTAKEYAPGVGEFVGGAGGAIGGGMLAGPAGAVAGAGSGAIAGRQLGKAVAGEGLMSAGEAATTGVVNAAGEGIGAAVGKGLHRLLSVRPFQEAAGKALDFLKGVDREVIGKEMRDEILGPMREQVTKQASARYRKVIDLANRAKISVPNPNRVAATADEFLAKIGDPKDSIDPATASQIVSELKKIKAWTHGPTNAAPEPRDVMAGLGGSRGTRTVTTRSDVPFEEYYNSYRNLQAHFDDFRRLGMPADLEEAIQGRLLGSMKADIDRAIKGTPAERALRAADDYFQNEKAPFRELIFKPAAGVLREEPSRLLNTILEPGHPERFRAWWSKASEKNQNALRAAWMERALNESMDTATNTFSAGGFAKEFYSLDPTVRKTMMRGHEAEYKELFDHLASAQLAEKFAGQSGGMIRGFGPGGLTAHAGYALFLRGNIRDALGSLVAAGGLAAALSSPKTVQLLVRGIKLQPGTRDAMRVGRKIVMSAISSGMVDPAARQALGIGQGYDESLR